MTIVERERGARALDWWWRDRRGRSALLTFAAFLLLTAEEWLWGSARLDRALTNLLENPDTRLLDRISSVLLTVGGVEVTSLLIVAAAALLYWRGQRRAAIALGVAFLCALTVEGVLKLALHHPDVPYKFAPPGLPEPPNSYPSGHVLRAALLGTAAILLVPRRATRIAALCFVVLVAYTRIYSGAHWTSDIVGAALLAWTLHVATTRAAAPVDRAAPW